MRLISFLSLCVLALTASADDFRIVGKASADADGKKLYLIDQNTLVKVDSCIVAGGVFEFKGSTDEQLLFELKGVDNQGRRKVYIFVQPASTVIADVAAVPAKVSDDGGLNDILAAIEDSVNVKNNALNARVQQLAAEGKNRDEIAAIINPDIEAFYDIYRKGIDNNKDNMVGAYLLATVAPQFYPSLGELEEAMAQVKYADKIAFIRQIKGEFLKAGATQPGAMFVDFEGLALDGSPSKLSDYVGKGRYVLVDFWASWCGPCKREIPHLLELQNKYGGDKFTVLGVNVWDEEAKFKAALESEGINYPQIFVPRNNKDNATELYGIKGIPQIILFGPDGKIIKRDLRGDEMKALVGEKMK